MTIIANGAITVALYDIVVVVMEWNQSAHGSMYSICCCHPTLTCTVRVSASARDTCRSYVKAAATVGKACRRL
jgi:hypothetical protein